MHASPLGDAERSHGAQLRAIPEDQRAPRAVHHGPLEGRVRFVRRRDAQPGIDGARARHRPVGPALAQHFHRGSAPQGPLAALPRAARDRDLDPGVVGEHGRDIERAGDHRQRPHGERARHREGRRARIEHEGLSRLDECSCGPADNLLGGGQDAAARGEIHACRVDRHGPAVSPSKHAPFLERQQVATHRVFRNTQHSSKFEHLHATLIAQPGFDAALALLGK